MLRLPGFRCGDDFCMLSRARKRFWCVVSRIARWSLRSCEDASLRVSMTGGKEVEWQVGVLVIYDEEG